MAKNKKTETPTADDKILFDAMPGSDAKTEEDAKGFEVDMNFDTPDEEVEFPKEDEIEEVEELKAEEEPVEELEEEAEEEVLEATDESEEDTGEETVLAEDDGDTQQPVEPVQETVAETKEPMIPKSRFDEVLAKQKALAKQLQEATNPIEPVTEAPTYDFETKEVEYQDHILNGNSKEAAALRAEIRQAEKQTMMFEVQQQMGQTVQQSTEAMALQNKALEIQNAFPQLDENNAAYDKAATEEVMDLRDAFMVQGFSGADALDKAVKYVVQPAAAPVVDNTQQKQVAQKKKVANTTKKLQAADSQPPTMKTGKQKVEKKVDLNLLSADEFEALPEETLRRMRGDFG
jgi:hypothetical protein